jgi:hypothetical protein
MFPIFLYTIHNIFCQTEPEVCAQKPCGKYGTCYDVDNDHLCVCEDGSVGKSCNETGDNNVHLANYPLR